MNNLIVIVEGETEQTFVRDQLAGHLAIHDINAWPVLPGRHRKHGGVKKWPVAREDIIRTLKSKQHCSTMFDYYAMPADWPGRRLAQNEPWQNRASIVETKIQNDIAEAMGGSFNPAYFVPYVQLHEFEALTFADVEVLASVLTPISVHPPEKLVVQFSDIVTEAGCPEAINDGYETCPSRRITKLVPAYKKRAQGPIVTNRIGLDALRAKCEHFGEWLNKLEKIGSE